MREAVTAEQSGQRYYEHAESSKQDRALFHIRYLCRSRAMVVYSKGGLYNETGKAH